MRNDLTIPELKLHSRLWQLAQNQKARYASLSSMLLTKGWRSGTEMHEWRAPAFTRRLNDRMSFPDYGFCVAYRDTQDYFGMEGLRKAIIHANDNGEGIIGAWYNKDNGKVYFDSVRLVKSYNRAYNLANFNGQIAFYDLTSDFVIYRAVGKKDVVVKSPLEKKVENPPPKYMYPNRRGSAHF